MVNHIEPVQFDKDEEQRRDKGETDTRRQEDTSGMYCLSTSVLLAMYISFTHTRNLSWVYTVADNIGQGAGQDSDSAWVCTVCVQIVV